MKRVFVGGPLDGEESTVEDLREIEDPESISRQLLGVEVRYVRDKISDANGNPVIAVYRVKSVLHLDGHGATVFLEHIGWKLQPAA